MVCFALLSSFCSVINSSRLLSAFNIPNKKIDLNIKDYGTYQQEETEGINKG
jgi:hypothetical protein